MRAFSLVELSIVLVILGLLTGGILAGRSVIRAAELRSVITEYRRYETAVPAFRDQYAALAGDMNNATQYWNRQVNQAWCLPTSGASVTAPGTCNGNGDNTLTQGAAANQSGELFQFWRQLALAGLIEGTYSGIAGGNSAASVVIGENAPISRFGENIVWSTRYVAGGGGLLFANWTTSNVFLIGGAPAVNDDGDHVAFSAREMWNLDSKLDDGLPAYGIMRSHNATTRPNCATSDTAETAIYAVSANAGTTCSPFIRF